jgi:hypothetical protein
VNGECDEPFLLELKTKETVALVLQEAEVFAKLGAPSSQPEGGPHPVDELGRTDRLGEEIVSTRAQSAVEGFDVTLSRQEEDRRVGAERKCPNMLAHREAVHCGHANVEKDTLGAVCFEGGQPFPTVVGEENPVAVVSERILRESAVPVVVVDNENCR